MPSKKSAKVSFATSGIKNNKKKGRRFSVFA